MVVLDMLGRRTALRVLWELRGAPLTFRALQEVCETNPAVLNTRLRELREAGLVEHDEGGYRLSESGSGLAIALAPLSRWAEEWARGQGAAHLSSSQTSPVAPKQPVRRG
jgi:DNA-binding HxlR family transcriptional regulator